jgi:hypothetical protein
VATTTGSDAANLVGPASLALEPNPHGVPFEH